MPQAVANETNHVLQVRRDVLEGLDVRRVLELVAPSVLGAVRSIVGASHPDCEDLVQEALIGVVHALPQFRGECSLVHFAKQIAVRRAIDWLRTTIRERRKREALGQADERGSEPSLFERKQRMWRDLLAELPAQQAEALALRAVEGYSIDEIAQMTSAPLETVRSRLRLAKTTLRQRIESDPKLADLVEEGDNDLS
jgi:RNA polymerase sigma-70 factor (ECF subfamily)